MTTSLLVVVSIAVLTAASRAGTVEDRAALFDYIFRSTLERESISPVKCERLGFDVREEMLRLRQRVLEADTDEELFYALAALSNARRDPHLRVTPVAGGLALEHTEGLEQDNYPVEGTKILHAPLRLYADFGDPDERFLFVRDFAENLEDLVVGMLPNLGDRVAGVNGMPFDAYVEAVLPYQRYASENGLWWQLAEWLPQKSYHVSPRLYRERLELTFERPNGERFDLSLPYLPPESIRWLGHGERRYPGFDHTLSTPTFDLYENAEGEDVLVLSWHGFPRSLFDDVDRLVAYAEERGLLDHALVFDGTRSRGGAFGAYAVQRLVPRPFKTTFGNLRLSDVTQAFIEAQKSLYEKGQLARVPRDKGIDDGTWLLDWLEGDVRAGLAAEQEYSNDVPFKLAHLPEHSDGIVRPAPAHFRGPLVVLLGPYGGSHLDQFASIIVDNELGHTIGMPVAGYSNTWEWEEVLTFPRTGQPVVRYMWSIGHTIRPNGQILEGNPAGVHELVPLTRDNFERYHEELLERAMKHLDAQR